MKFIEHINGEPRIRWYWAVVFFTAVIVFFSLAVAASLWAIFRDARVAATSFVFSFPIGWFGATLFLRRRFRKAHDQAA